MIESSCHCGAIRMAIQAAPEEVNDCNCSICRRYGVLWAYYPPKDVRMIMTTGDTERYLWGEKSLEFHRCRKCGCVTHWAAVEQPCDRMGVNARLMDPEILSAARVRHSDGASM